MNGFWKTTLKKLIKKKSSDWKTENGIDFTLSDTLYKN